MWQERLHHSSVYIHPSSPCSAEMEEKQLACPHPFKDKLKHTPLFLTQAPVPSCSFHIALGCTGLIADVLFVPSAAWRYSPAPAMGPAQGNGPWHLPPCPKSKLLPRARGAQVPERQACQGWAKQCKIQNRETMWNTMLNAQWAPCLYLLWSAPKDWKHFALAGLSSQSECCRSRRRDDFKPRHLVRFNSNHSNVEAQPSKRSGHLWPTVNLTDFSHFFPISSNHPNMSIHVNTVTTGRRRDTIDVGVWSNMTFKELTCLRPWDVQRIHVCSWSIWFRRCSLQGPRVFTGALCSFL